LKAARTPLISFVDRSIRSLPLAVPHRLRYYLIPSIGLQCTIIIDLMPIQFDLFSNKRSVALVS
jgi:hypothetical protein